MSIIDQENVSSLAPDLGLFWQHKIVLVTGGAGAIGSNLVHRLSKEGAAKIIVVDDLSQGFRWRVPSVSNVQFICGSVTDEKILKDIFKESPSIVFHLAALFANQHSVEYPELDLLSNGLGTLKVLENALSYQVKRIIYAASSTTRPDIDQPESIGFSMQTPYQITKLLGEFYCDFFSHYHGLVTVRPRLFNSYGPGDVPGPYRNVIPNFIYCALQGKPLQITGSGDETRDFTFVEDHVEGLLHVASCESAANKTFDLGSGIETRIADLAELINELTGNRAGITHVPQKKWDTVSRRAANTHKARTLIGYSPSTPLKAGLVRTIQWFRDNWDKVLSVGCRRPIGRECR